MLVLQTISNIGLAQPGKIMRGVTANDCERHLHQLHVCTPSKKGYTRLLYRMSMDFMSWIRYVPNIEQVWKGVAGQVRAWGAAREGCVQVQVLLLQEIGCPSLQLEHTLHTICILCTCMLCNCNMQMVFNVCSSSRGVFCEGDQIWLEARRQ